MFHSIKEIVLSSLVVTLLIHATNTEH